MAPPPLTPIHNQTTPNSTAFSSHATPTLAQVSWQSAFWGLVSIALNTCLQEPSTVLEIDADLALSVRSSPVVCLLDSILTWMQLMYWSWEQGLWRATRTVERARRLDHVDTKSSIQSLLAKALLVLLAGLQATKVFGYQGVPWTQAFAAVFLLNFFTNLWLSTFGQTAHVQSLGDNKPFHGYDYWPSSKFVNLLVALASVLQIVIWLVTLERIWTTALTANSSLIAIWLAFIVSLGPIQMVTGFLFLAAGLFTILYITVMLLISAAVASGLIYLYNKLRKPRIPSVGYGFGILLTVGGTVLLVRYVGLTPPRKFYAAVVPFQLQLFGLEGSSKISKWVTAACLLAGQYLWFAGISYILVKLWVTVTRTSDSEKEMQSLRHYWFILSTNFALTFLYFRYVYVQEGTFKLSWTENLG